MTGKQLKNSILQWAIQGKLVPQDPNDEPASVLLEKIRAEKARLIKEGKIKKDKKESIIFRGEDNSYYEKFADGKVVCIDDEIPFEIPESWQWCRIKHLFSMQAGKNIKAFELSDTPTSSHTYPCYGGNGLRGYVNHYNTEGNFILVGRQGALCGNVKEVKGKFYATEHAVVTNGYGLTNLQWAYYFLWALDLNQYATATAQPGLAVSNIIEVLIPLPPFEEQIQIASKIDNTLLYVDSFTKAQKDLEVLNNEVILNLRKSILQEAIQGKLVPQDPNEESASVLLQRIKEEKQRQVKEDKLKKKDVTDSTIFKGDDNKYFEKKGKDTVCIDEEIPFEIPNTWEWVRLSDVVQVNPKNDVPDNTLSAFIPMERIDATYLSSFTYSERKWGDIKAGFTHFADGDVAFAKITPCFQNRKCMILKGLPNGVGAGTTELKVLRPYAETIDREYLLFFLESSYFVEEATFKGTANQQRIISGYMENKLFPLPPLSEQRRISEKIKESYKRIGL